MSGESLALTATPGEPVTVEAAPGEAVTLTPETGEPIVLEVVGAEDVTLEVSPGPAILIDVVTPAPVDLTVTDGEPVHLDVIGLIGPAGPPGPAGGGDVPGGTYRFHQSVPATVWTIPHGLGYRPAVSIEDSAGSLVEGDVTYPNENTVTVRFAAAFGGWANLS